VFGLDERNGERYEDMQKIVEKLNKGNSTIFVKLTMFSKNWTC
jgi:hypothetical protein